MEKNYTDKELELVFEKILKMYKSSYSPKEKSESFLVRRTTWSRKNWA